MPQTRAFRKRGARGAGSCPRRGFRYLDPRPREQAPRLGRWLRPQSQVPL